MAKIDDIREELLGLIDELQIIDSHEHLPMESDLGDDTDVLAEWLIHYFSCDLVSAGLSDEGLNRARDPKGDLAERWKLVEEYWEAARTTGYGRSLDIAARDLYGIDGVHGDTLADLNDWTTKCGNSDHGMKLSCAISDQ